MARCKIFELARLSYKQLMCQQVQKEHTLYSLVLAHNVQSKSTCGRLDTTLAEVWYTSLGKSSSCAAPLLWVIYSCLGDQLALILLFITNHWILFAQRGVGCRICEGIYPIQGKYDVQRPEGNRGHASLQCCPDTTHYL